MKPVIIMMPRFLVPVMLLVLVFTTCSHAQQYWIRQQCPTTKPLFRVAFVDTSSGWAVGDSGAIVHTTNGGTLWSEQQSNILSKVEDICFTDNLRGWAISNDFLFSGTIILKTTDGGVNWTNSRYPDTTFVFRTVYFFNSQTGFLGGFCGSDRSSVILKTTNGGGAWQRCMSGSNACSYFPVLRFNFYTSQTGYASGGVFDQGGVYWKTTDAGLNWVDSCIAGEPLFDILPLSDIKVIATGGDFEYGVTNYSSWDGGNSWLLNSLNILGVPQRIAHRTAGEFWIPCGDAQKMSVSSDTGSTWLNLLSPDSARIYDTKFVDEYHGWSVGCMYSYCSGAIYKYNASVIGIGPGSADIPSSYKLYQNYPNPFNPATLIRFYIPLESKVILNVYDVLGKRVMQFNRGVLQQGESSVVIDGSGLSSGLYFYELRASSRNSEFNETKRMVLLK